MVRIGIRTLVVLKNLTVPGQLPSWQSQTTGMTDDEVIRLTADNCKSLAKKGAEVLLAGHIIGVPTDTVYGLAADAQNNKAVARLYEIKSRDIIKPIAICVSQISQVYSWGKVTVPLALLQDFLPGPVTLVFERTSTLNPILNPGTNLVGIRIPDSPFIRHLAGFHGGPIALTSANPSSTPSTLTPEEFKPLWPSLKLVFNGGNLSESSQSRHSDTSDDSRAGSTVIDLSCEGHFRIIRRGSGYERCMRLLRDKYFLSDITDS